MNCLNTLIFRLRLSKDMSKKIILLFFFALVSVVLCEKAIDYTNYDGINLLEDSYDDIFQKMAKMGNITNYSDEMKANSKYFIDTLRGKISRSEIDKRCQASNTFTLPAYRIYATVVTSYSGVTVSQCDTNCIAQQSNGAIGWTWNVAQYCECIKQPFTNWGNSAVYNSYYTSGYFKNTPAPGGGSCGSYVLSGQQMWANAVAGPSTQTSYQACMFWCSVAGSQYVTWNANNNQQCWCNTNQWFANAQTYNAPSWYVLMFN